MPSHPRAVAARLLCAMTIAVSVAGCATQGEKMVESYNTTREKVDESQVDSRQVGISDPDTAQVHVERAMWRRVASFADLEDLRTQAVGCTARRRRRFPFEVVVLELLLDVLELLQEEVCLAVRRVVRGDQCRAGLPHLLFHPLHCFRARCLDLRSTRGLPSPTT